MSLQQLASFPVLYIYVSIQLDIIFFVIAYIFYSI